LDFNSDFSEFDTLVIPGGAGVLKVAQNENALDLVRKFHQRGAHIAAICAAPLVLKNAGVLEGKKRTSHPSVADKIGDCLNDGVVKDGNIITSRGAGTAIDFALALVEELAGKNISKDIANSICYIRE